MQYVKPDGDFFVGDCMPFFHDGTYHIFYLLDQGHHQGLGGLGGHQWAHASTRDLIHWKQHPLALPITSDWEASICTGSTFHHAGTFHAFYATRKKDWTQHLSHAVSSDGVNFTKTQPNPFMSAPAGYNDRDFRDPFVFTDADGRFHMLVTSKLKPFPLHDRGGCLAHLTSSDLKTWEMQAPLLIPGGVGYACIPECPDCFRWGEWYYLIFGLGLQTHYRISREPLGPWRRPAVATLDSRLCAVMKTAPFGGNRRVGAAWVGCRKENRDGGEMQWGGNLFFREIVQNADGTLGTRFVPEMVPATGAPVATEFKAFTKGVSGGASRVELKALETQEVAMLSGLPVDYRLRCRVQVRKGTHRFGLGLRGAGDYERCYELAFHPQTGRVSLAQESIESVGGLEGEFEVDVIVRGDLIDVCIAQQRCLINRLPELKGDRLFLFCENGDVSFSGIEVRPLV